MNDVVNPVERVSRYCYPGRTFKPAKSIKKCIRNAIVHHRTIILPITETFNTTYPDGFLIDVIRNKSRSNFICIKMQENVTIPLQFQDKVKLNFTEKVNDLSVEKNKFDRYLKKRLSKTISPSVSPILEAPPQEHQQQRQSEQSVSPPSRCSSITGPQIMPDVVKESETLYDEAHMKSRVRDHPIGNICHILLNKQDPSFKGAEYYAIEKMIPRYEEERALVELCQFACTVSSRVQTVALMSLENVLRLHIPAANELYTLENKIGSSFETFENKKLGSQVYCSIWRKIMLAIIDESVTVDQDNSQLCRDYVSNMFSQSVVHTLRNNYVKQVVLKALERHRQIQEGKNKKFVIFRQHLRRVSDLQTVFLTMDNIIQQSNGGDISFRQKEDVVDGILSLKWFEQFLALEKQACMISTTNDVTCKKTLLWIFQRALYKKKDETSRKYIVHIIDLSIDLALKCKDGDFCKLVLEGCDTDEPQLIGLANLWNLNIVQRDDVYKEYLMKVFECLLFHHSEEIRKTVTERLLQTKNTDEQSDIVVAEAQRVIQNRILHINAQQVLRKAKGDDQLQICPGNPRFYTWNGSLRDIPVKVNTLKMTKACDFVNGFTDTAGPIRKMNQELEILLAVTHHENITNLLAYQTTPSPYYIITEGWKENALEFLTRQQREGRLLSVKNLVNAILAPMLTAVSYCHENRIILRDTVSCNFYIKERPDESLGVKYFNFRLAKKMRQRSSFGTEDTLYEELDDGEIKCSQDDPVPLRYLPIESLDGHLYSTRSDSWGCSCLAYEVLTHGCQPYTELYGISSHDVIERVKMGYRMQQPTSIPDQLFTFIMGGFIARPRSRQTVQDLKANLIDCVNEPSTATTTAMMQPHKPPKRDKDQPKQPDRGIPKDQHGIISTIYLEGDSRTQFPCTDDEILASDDPSPGRKNPHVIEECISEKFNRSSEDEEAIIDLNHKNIAKVYRTVLQEDRPIQLSEKCDGPNLLYHCRKKSCEIDDVLNYLHGVASGMEYAHSQEWVHGCLKAKFIYVCDGIAKIGRWGRAFRPIVRMYEGGVHEATQIHHTPKDIFRWAPPETISFRIYSQKGDVFMFSQVCWEAFNAYAQNKECPEKVLVPYPNLEYDKISDALSRRERQIQPPDCPDWLFCLMKRMWLSEKSMRPSFPIIMECIAARSTDPIKADLQRLKEEIRPGIKRSLTMVEITEELDNDDINYYKSGTIEHQNEHEYIYRHNVTIPDHASPNDSSSADPAPPSKKKGTLYYNIKQKLGTVRLPRQTKLQAKSTKASTDIYTTPLPAVNAEETYMPLATVVEPNVSAIEEYTQSINTAGARPKTKQRQKFTNYVNKGETSSESETIDFGVSAIEEYTQSINTTAGARPKTKQHKRVTDYANKGETSSESETIDFDQEVTRVHNDYTGSEYENPNGSIKYDVDPTYEIPDQKPDTPELEHSPRTHTRHNSDAGVSPVVIDQDRNRRSNIFRKSSSESNLKRNTDCNQHSDTYANVEQGNAHTKRITTGIRRILSNVWSQNI
ncbi:uncharacterized protein LOC144355684 [Saccoglossus kowalevskii]